MSTDLFGMAVENRKSIRELIIRGLTSSRIGGNFIKPIIFDNVHLISLDNSLIIGLLLCKHSHMLLTDMRWNTPVFLNHLAKFHGVELKERKPKPTINPIQLTETPITINMMEREKELKVKGNDNTESGIPNVLGPQV